MWLLSPSLCFNFISQCLLLIAYSTFLFSPASSIVFSLPFLHSASFIRSLGISYFTDVVQLRCAPFFNSLSQCLHLITLSTFIFLRLIILCFHLFLRFINYVISILFCAVVHISVNLLCICYLNQHRYAVNLLIQVEMNTKKRLYPFLLTLYIPMLALNCLFYIPFCWVVLYFHPLFS